MMEGGYPTFWSYVCWTLTAFFAVCTAAAIFVRETPNRVPAGIGFAVVSLITLALGFGAMGSVAVRNAEEDAAKARLDLLKAEENYDQAHDAYHQAEDGDPNVRMPHRPNRQN